MSAVLGSMTLGLQTGLVGALGLAVAASLYFAAHAILLTSASVRSFRRLDRRRNAGPRTEIPTEMRALHYCWMAFGICLPLYIAAIAMWQIYRLLRYGVEHP